MKNIGIKLLDNITIVFILTSIIVFLIVSLIFDYVDLLSKTNLSYDFWIATITMSIPLLMALYVFVLERENSDCKDIVTYSGINLNQNYSTMMNNYKKEISVKATSFYANSNLEGQKYLTTFPSKDETDMTIYLTQGLIKSIYMEFLEYVGEVNYDIEQIDGLISYNILKKHKLKIFKKNIYFKK